MKKISTLYKKDENDLSVVTKIIDENNSWVFKYGIPTRKFDGTACMIKNNELYKRYDAKSGYKTKYNKKTKQYEQIYYEKKATEGAIPCQEKDEKSGHQPFWVKCDREKSEDKWYFDAFDKQDNWEDGTYECCGTKFQTNPEHFDGNYLIKHGCEVLDIKDFTYDGLKDYLSNPELDIEGIVFHDSSGQGRMCKIRKCDFAIER